MPNRALGVSVLGGGSWGTTFAHVVAARSPTLLWARDREVVADINQHRTNQRYLPGVKLARMSGSGAPKLNSRRLRGL